MGRRWAVALYVLALVTVVVVVDVVFFQHRFWERLIANVGIVLVFVGVYLTLRHVRASHHEERDTVGENEREVV